MANPVNQSPQPLSPTHVGPTTPFDPGQPATTPATNILDTTTPEVGSGSNPTVTKFNSSGWYVFGAIVVSTALGGTRIAPLVLGIMTVALIYQFGLMLEGK